MRMIIAIVASTVFPAMAVAAGNASVKFDGNGALAIEGDKYCMNWILKADGSQYRFVGKESAWGRVNGADGFEISRSRRADGGDIVESVTLRNPRSEAAVLEGVSVNFPFNDNYPESHECVKRRCNAHLWPHGSAAWACAMRMGGEAPHLGWMLTKGEVDGYTISNRGRKNGSSNFRGVIAFRLPKVELAPGGEYTLEWRLFAHDGWDDFKAKLDERGGLWVEADRYVGAVGDEIAVTCENSKGKSVRKVRLDAPGEKIVDVEVEGKKTRVELLAISDFKKFIGRRLDFVLAHQQYGKADDQRDGAFLPYDNETGELRKAWLGPFIAKGIPEPDMNEGRERLGMGIAIAEAIRGMGYDNPAALAALRKYASFVRSRLQDKNCKTWGDYAPRKRHRIYNYAWVARFYFDMYDITGEGQYLEDGFQTARATFRFGGHKFYLIDMPVRQSIEALRKAGRGEDAKALLEDYRKVAENYIANGLFVPKSEVNYEQSIIAPAADFLVEMFLVTKERKYLDGAMAFLPAVEAFNGRQPSWHLNDVSIRHWDGYWFGKRKTWGDTMPHYWSCITADYFGNLAEATGDANYRKRAGNICAANLGLFTEDGRGGCAFVYPDAVNGIPARFLEPLSNDENYAIAYAARWLQ